MYSLSTLGFCLGPHFGHRRWTRLDINFGSSQGKRGRLLCVFHISLRDMFIEVISHSSGQVDIQGSEGPAIPESDGRQLEVVCIDMYARMGDLDIFGPTPNQFNHTVGIGSGVLACLCLSMVSVQFLHPSGSPYNVVQYMGCL